MAIEFDMQRIVPASPFRKRAGKSTVRSCALDIRSVYVRDTVFCWFDAAAAIGDGARVMYARCAKIIQLREH